MDNQEKKIETIEEKNAKMKQTMEEKQAMKIKNQKTVKVLKMVVYVLTGLMLLHGVLFAIVKIMLDKKIFYTSVLCPPVILLLLGVLAIILPIINNKASNITSIKGDKTMKYIGIALIVAAVIFAVFLIATY